MQTKVKSNSIVTHAVSEELISLTIVVPKTLTFFVKDNGDVSLDLSKVSPENMGRACMHGWLQRLPDAAAISRTDADGNFIPEATRTRMKKEGINDLCIHYESGTTEWSRKPSGDGSGNRSITIEAIARVKGRDYDAAKIFVEEHAKMHNGGDTKKALAFLRTGKRVAEAIIAIRNERAAASSGNQDADAMLDEMTAE